LVDWPQLLAFVEDRMPGLGEKIRGASPAELDALRKRSPLPLPENYVGFLRHFGGADGGFRVFPRHFYLAAELLNGSVVGWNPERYLLIGIMEDKLCEDPLDLFLDLSHGDATDAPLVGLETRDADEDDDDDDEPEQVPVRRAYSLADRLLVQIAWRCAILNKTAKARLVALCQPSTGDAAVFTRYRELVGVAEKLGFAPCVSATAHNWLGRRDGETFAAIHISLTDDLVAMELRGDDPGAVAQVREVVDDLGLAKPSRIIGD
jgi:hypothetical protein